jgi:2-polyprenyl-3-methyl-5-hydroxy-6-metoxy-1,4-benzoquinol methylase
MKQLPTTTLQQLALFSTRFETTMDPITQLLKDYHHKVFLSHGPTAKGVDWGDENEVLLRYDKMLKVVDMDFYVGPARPTILDVGCGWGAMAKRARDRSLDVSIVGVDVVEEMIVHARTEFPEHSFNVADVFVMPDAETYDFVVCNAIRTPSDSQDVLAVQTWHRIQHDVYTRKLHGFQPLLPESR